MNTKLLRDILASDVDCGATIVTVGSAGVHVTNTWNSFIELISDDTIYIPVGGYNTTEANLKNDNHITLSITNRVVAGLSGTGTGVIVHGTGEIVYDSSAMAHVKKNFPWIRAVLQIKIMNITQTM